MTLEVTKLMFYLSYQDGRVNNIDYNTREEAEIALNKINYNRDICIMCYRKKIM